MSDPITSFEDLAKHQAAELLNRRKAIVVQGGSVYRVDRADVDGIELGGRVADELNS